MKCLPTFYKAVKKLFGIPLSKVVWAFRIDFDKDISLLETYPKYIEESDFPAINRNYSLVAPEELLWNNIVEILSVKLPETSKLHLLPLERIKSDNNSVILNFQANIQSYEKTLEGTEVDLWEKNWQEKLFAEFTGTSIR